MTDCGSPPLRHLREGSELRDRDVNRWRRFGRRKIMSAGGRTARNLYVKRRFVLEQSVVAQQLSADLHESRGRVVATELYSDSVETTLQSLVVESCGEQPPSNCPHDFVHAITEHEAAILDGYDCFRPRQDPAIYIDEILAQPVFTPVALYSHPLPLKTGVAPGSGSVTVPLRAPAAVSVPLKSIRDVVFVADA